MCVVSACLLHVCMHVYVYVHACVRVCLRRNVLLFCPASYKSGAGKTAQSEEHSGDPPHGHTCASSFAQTGLGNSLVIPVWCAGKFGLLVQHAVWRRRHAFCDSAFSCRALVRICVPLNLKLSTKVTEMSSFFYVCALSRDRNNTKPKRLLSDHSSDAQGHGAGWLCCLGDPAAALRPGSDSGVRFPICRYEKVLLPLVDLNFCTCKVGIQLDNVAQDTVLNNSSA